jgi:hypothetical protein
MVGMRLRTLPLLVVIVLCLAALGAWTDRLQYKTEAPLVAAATKPWTAVVKVTRRGRAIEGYRAYVTLTGPRGTERVAAQEVGGGVYRFRVKLAGGGFYSYTILVGDRIASRGTVYAVPN